MSFCIISDKSFDNVLDKERFIEYTMSMTIETEKKTMDAETLEVIKRVAVEAAAEAIRADRQRMRELHEKRRIAIGGKGRIDKRQIVTVIARGRSGKSKSFSVYGLEIDEVIEKLKAVFPTDQPDHPDRQTLFQ